MIPLSILDLAPIVQGSDASEAFRRSLDLAQHAERWGYRRFWLAEHHGMPGIASAATSVLIGHVAAGTTSIRVGSGGIMLPNHAPLVIAEQFGTLAALFPGRIDLGVGRAPGSDAKTSRALRRDPSAADTFPDDVVELIDYFKPPNSGQRIRAVPCAGQDVPVWILGSSLFGARLAARLGLPFSFASHFAPAMLMPALDAYRSEFRPSEHLAKPYAMPGLNVFAADTDREARRIWSSLAKVILDLQRGRPRRLAAPEEGFVEALTEEDRYAIDGMLQYSAVGSPETVREWLKRFVEMTKADELMISCQVFDHSARLRSYEIAAGVRG
ncbi:MAG: LLM class flavin-dependent oxidoreductase [Planctomycetia bacterium]|nr:LLM class flavin-dependent oxidoreductase [Planctomycetia bacterium]